MIYTIGRRDGVIEITALAYFSRSCHEVWRTRFVFENSWKFGDVDVKSHMPMYYLSLWNISAVSYGRNWYDCYTVWIIGRFSFFRPRNYVINKHNKQQSLSLFCICVFVRDSRFIVFSVRLQMSCYWHISKKKTLSQVFLSCLHLMSTFKCWCKINRLCTVNVIYFTSYLYWEWIYIFILPNFTF